MKHLGFISLAFLLAVAITVASCKKDEDTNNFTSDALSGVYHSENQLYLYDSIPALLSFSFDELGDGTIKGGVRICLEQGSELYPKHLYKNVHKISKWQRNNDGSIDFEGNCLLDDEIGKVSFSGTFTENKTFNYSLTASDFSTEGTAKYAGEYFKNNSLKNANAASSYLGNYSLKCGGHKLYINSCGKPIKFDDWYVNMTINKAEADGQGGIDFSGDMSSHGPKLNGGLYSWNYPYQSPHITAGNLAGGKFTIAGWDIPQSGYNWFYFQNNNGKDWTEPKETYTAERGFYSRIECSSSYGNYYEIQGEIEITPLK